MNLGQGAFKRKTIKLSKSWEKFEYSVNLVINGDICQLSLDAAPNN